MLELKNVFSNYYDFEFELEDISFSLDKGYIMGLIGPNGSGKTTIIKLIMRLMKVQKGEIKIFGLLNNLENNYLIKDRIGFVFDENIYPDYLNLDKLRFIYKNIYSSFDDEYFDYLVEKLNVSLYKKLKDLSKGNIMKCQIALALSHNADLIIMDEPSAGLDPIIRRDLLKILRDYRNKTNAAILFSTHITEDLEEIADYISFINNGHLVFSEDIESLREKYKIVITNIKNKNLLDLSDFLGYDLGNLNFSGLIEKDKLSKYDLTLFTIKDASITDIMYNLYKG